jgi:uncharacterized protein (TIGR03437 family)
MRKESSTRLFYLLAIVWLLSPFPPTVFAQVTCLPPGGLHTIKVSGTISDEMGNPVTGVQLYRSNTFSPFAVSKADGTWEGSIQVCALSPPRCSTGFNARISPVSTQYIFEPSSGEFCPDNSIRFIASPARYVNVSAANYRPTLAPGSIAAAFAGTGTALATGTAQATTLPLPEMLGGSSLTIRAYNSFVPIDRKAGLFFASTGQLNYYIPPDIPSGPAALTLQLANGETLRSSVLISPVAPALFAANSSGQGVAAAVLLRIRENGTSQYEPVAQLNPATNCYEPLAIDLGPPTDRLVLALFGTGFRGRSSLDKVTATIGGVPVVVDYAGPQGQMDGVDQANLFLDRSLAGRGDVNVTIVVDGQLTNTIVVRIK